MHGPFPEPSYKGDRHQVEKAIDEAFQTKFAFSVLALTVLHHLLSYFGKARPLRDHGNITVHLTIHLDGLHHIFTISLKPAIEIMQVIYFGNPARGPVE